MFRKLLVANRGEVAVRVFRTAKRLGLSTVAICSRDDESSLHVRHADAVERLPGSGAAAYLDIAEIVEAAGRAGAEAVHPGYGFLSENASFARACRDAGLVFVGPAAEAIELFGDKARARALAIGCGVPVLRGTEGATTVQQAEAFFDSIDSGASIMVKAVAGGGGRGIRAVSTRSDVRSAVEGCASEAERSFGCGDVYVEEFLPRARHIEVQILGDRDGTIVHLGERECTLQRRHQKLVEMAPSPSLSDALRAELFDASLKMAKEAAYEGAGTFEFLIDASDPSRWAFMEANARLQVEHTVTEEVTGLDLVALQLSIAAGEPLPSECLRFDHSPSPNGFAVQCRLNAEKMTKKGRPLPSAGRVTEWILPTGEGVRVDTSVYQGYEMGPAFDSLLAKVVVHSSESGYRDSIQNACAALREIRVDGVSTNASYLLALLSHPSVQANDVTTRFAEERAMELLTSE